MSISGTMRNSILVSVKVATAFVVIALLLAASSLHAQTNGTVMPVERRQFMNAAGTAPCASCRLYFYSAGTTTPEDTFSLVTLDPGSVNPNPVVLNSAGRPSVSGNEVNIYFSATSYKVVLKTSADVTIYTADNVTATHFGVTGVTNSGDVSIQVDSDNDGSNVMKLLDGTGTIRFQVDESGNAQIDGNLTVGDGTEADKSVNFDGNVQDYHIGVDDSADALVIGRGAVLGTTPAITVASTGATTLAGAVTLVGAVTASAASTGLAVTNDATVGGALTVTGAITGAGIDLTAPKLTLSTVFETAARYTVTNVAGGGTAFNTVGADLTTSATISSSTVLSWAAVNAINNGGLFTTFPGELSTQLLFGPVGTDFQAFAGLGTPTIGGAGYTYTVNHIGFKVVRAASGTISLFATQADGTETASSALTTIVANDALDLFLRVISASSVKYYWRKNGSAWSSATTLAANVPTLATVGSITIGVSNAGVATATEIWAKGATYSR